MTETEIVNGNEEECDVWIDRRSKLGNPFKISDWNDKFPDEVARRLVIDLFRTYFRYKVRNDDQFKEKLEEIEGQTLGCHCKPKPCHGDVYKEYFENGNTLNWECNDCGNINPHSTLKCLKCGSMTDRLRNWIMW